MVSGRTGSTDYLLKDEMEEEENSIIKSEEISTRRYVTMEEANAFLSVKEETSKIISNGVFIYSGSKTAPYEYLEKEVFETEYGVTGMVKERRESFKRIYTRNNIIGVCLCVMALIPLFGGAIVNGEDDVFMVSMFSVSLVIVGIGVIFLVRGGIIWASFEKLLQEGDYSRRKKEHPGNSLVTIVYWLVVTAIYLAITLPTESWKEGWIIWVIAAVLFPAVIAVANAIDNKKEK